MCDDNKGELFWKPFVASLQLTLITNLKIKINVCFFQLKAWEEQQASWENQKAELEQRAEDGEEKADKLEKYNTSNSVLRLCLSPCYCSIS